MTMFGYAAWLKRITLLFLIRVNDLSSSRKTEISWTIKKLPKDTFMGRN